MTSLQLLLGFLLNFSVALLIIRGIYYPARRNKEFVLACFALTTSVFLIASLLGGIDLSVGSPIYSGNPSKQREHRLTKNIFDEIERQNGEIGVGKYGEARLLYANPAFETNTGAAGEHRTVHLGIDLFAKPGTPVSAPISGQIHDFASHAAPFNYGPVIIIKHTTDDGEDFRWR